MSDADITQEDGSVAEEKVKLNLEVEIDSRGTCERHVTVTVSREDVDRYVDNAFDEIRDKRKFRLPTGPGPRKLVRSRFKEQIAEQVKGSLLMDSMEQVNEDHQLSAISEPDLDLDAVVIPDEGPLTFEFNLEVRPDFEVPEWEGLELERPVHDYSDEDVENNLKRLLERFSDVVPVDEPAESNDFLTVNATFLKDGEEVSKLTEEQLRVCRVLTFRDATFEGFDDVAKGAKAGDALEFQVTVSDGAENEALRGSEVDVKMEVLDVKRIEYPELKGEFLDKIGGFQDADDLRDTVREELEKQLQYYQQRRIREQITEKLTESADWDLPPNLLRKQYRRELDRAVLELRAAGFDDEAIRSYENRIRQNSLESTRTALKEHFILERIAEDREIDVESGDFDDEIKLIADQSNESPRRVRARLEKKDQMDSLRNQIVERKVIEMISESASFSEVDFEPPKKDSQAVEHAVGGESASEIPEAMHGEEASELPEAVDRT